MNQQEYMSQKDLMIIPHLPKYTFMISMATDQKTRENLLILSFSLAPTELLGPSSVSQKEMETLAMKSEILGQLIMPVNTLKEVIKRV